MKSPFGRALIAVCLFILLFSSVPLVRADATQDLINSLLAQVATLQAQLARLTGSSSGAIVVAPVPTTRLFSSTNPQLQVGSRGGEVEKLQRALSGLGYRVSTDGIFDRETQAAVSAFQRNSNITPAVGYVGSITAAALTAQTNTNNSFTTNSTANNSGGGSNTGLPFSISISPATVTINPGERASYTVTVTPQSGFSGQVIVTTNYSDSNLLAQTTAANIFVNGSPIYGVVNVSGGPATATVEVRTTTQVLPNPHYGIKILAYQEANTAVTVEANAVLNVLGGCNDPGSGLPACGTPFPVNCLPDAGGNAQFDKEVLVGEKTRFVASGGGNHIVWSAPGATPASKDNTTQGACTYAPIGGPTYPAGYCPQDGVFETTFNQEGSYLVTVSSPPDTITQYPNQQAGAPAGPHATCKVKVSRAATPPPPGSLSCTVTGANSTFGVINYTVPGATADTQCSWSCTPGTQGCPTTANAVGAGGQSYGPVLTPTQITLTCNRPNGTNYSAATATCSTTIGGTGTGTTGTTGNSTSSNSTSTGTTGTGTTGTGNTGTGTTGTGTTGGAGFNCNANFCTPVTTGAQYSTLQSCRTACSAGGNTGTGTTGTGTTGTGGGTASTTAALSCAPASQTVSINPATGAAGATFTASGASTYSWFSAGANPISGSGATFNPSYSTPGTYTAVVTGSNPLGIAACTVQVTTAGSSAGTPTCTASPANPIVGQQVVFSAQGGTGSYTWATTAGTGQSGTGSLFVTTFATSGSKTVTVTSGGTSGTCSVNVGSAISGGSGTVTNFTSSGIRVLSPQAGASFPVDGGINYLDKIWYRVDSVSQTPSGSADLLKDGVVVRSFGNFPVACGTLSDPTLCTYPGNLLNAPANGADLVPGDNYRVRVRGTGGSTVGYSAPFSLRRSSDIPSIANEQLQVVSPTAGQSFALTTGSQTTPFVDIAWTPARAGVSKVELVREGTSQVYTIGDSSLGSMPQVFYGYYPFRIQLDTVPAGSYKVRVTDTIGRTALSSAFSLTSTAPSALFSFDRPLSSQTLRVGDYPNFRDFYFKVSATSISATDSIIDWKVVEVDGKDPVANNTIPVVYPNFDYVSSQWKGYLRVNAVSTATPGSYRFQVVARVQSATGGIRIVPSEIIDFTVTSGATSATSPQNQNLASVLDAAKLLLQQLLGKL